MMRFLESSWKAAFVCSHPGRREGGREGGEWRGQDALASQSKANRPPAPGRRGGGAEGVLSPGAPSSSGSGSLSVCPSAAPTLLPRRRVPCPPTPALQRRPGEKGGGENNLTASPPGGGSGGPSPVPPRPGESRRRRCRVRVSPSLSSLPLFPPFCSRDGAAEPGGRLLRLSSSLTGGGQASRHRLAKPPPSPPSSRWAAAHRDQALPPRGLPFAKGSRLSHPSAKLIPPALGSLPPPAPQPLRGQGAPAPGPRAGGGRSCAVGGGGGEGDGDGLCPEGCRLCACVFCDRIPGRASYQLLLKFNWEKFPSSAAELGTGGVTSAKPLSRRRLLRTWRQRLCPVRKHRRGSRASP